MESYNDDNKKYRKEVYDYLSNNGYTDSYELFDEDMNDENRRREFHNYLTENGLTDDFDTFSKNIGNSQPEPPATKPQDTGTLSKESEAAFNAGAQIGGTIGAMAAKQPIVEKPVENSDEQPMAVVNQTMESPEPVAEPVDKKSEEELLAERQKEIEARRAEVSEEMKKPENLEAAVQDAYLALDAPGKFVTRGDERNSEYIAITTKNYTDNLVNGLFETAYKQARDYSATSSDMSVWGTEDNISAMSNAKKVAEMTDPNRIRQQALDYLKNDKTAIKENAARYVMELQQKVDYPIDVKAFQDYVYTRALIDTLAKVDKVAEKYNPSGGVLGGLQDSIIGNLTDAMISTPGHVQARERATAEWSENAGFWERVGRGSVSFVADTPFFGLTGAVAEGTIARVAARQLASYMERGLSRAAAERVIATRLANSFGEKAADRLLKGSLSGAINLGSYGAISEGAHQLAVGEFDAGALLGRVAKDAFSGAALGVTGSAWGFATANVSGMPKLLANVAGVGIEAGTFTATGELEKWATGNADQINWTEDFLENLAMVGSMKAASPVKSFKALFNTKAEQTPNVPRFTQAEVDEIRASKAGENLYQIITDGKHTPEEYQDAYERFISDPDISFTSKQKVSYALTESMQRRTPTVYGYDMETAEDGKTVISTKAADGMIVERMAFDTKEEADAYAEQLTAAIIQGETVKFSVDAGMAAAKEVQSAIGLSDGEMQAILTGEDMSERAVQLRQAVIDRFNKLTVEREEAAANLEEQKALPFINNDKQTFRPATLKAKDDNGRDQDVFIVDGEVRMFEDGSMVDAENSDKTIIIYNPATGQKEFVSPEYILNIGQPIEASSVVERPTLHSEEFGDTAAENGMQGTPKEYEPLMDLCLRDEDGNEEYALVTGRRISKEYTDDGGLIDVEDPNGNFVEVLYKGELTSIRKDELDKMVVSYNSAEKAAAEPQGTEVAEENTPAERVSEAPEPYVGRSLSDKETDEFGKPMVLAKDGTTTFGSIEADSGLTAAPIRLSLGENTIDNEGKNHGYGLLHIEASHGSQIRNAGYDSVEQFVEDVAKNYTDIREGALIGNNQTYLLELSDERNNTLFIQLSKDGAYWNVNSAGIFRKKYSRRKPIIHAVPAVGESAVTGTSEVNSGHNEGATAPAGNSPSISDGKVTNNSGIVQENGGIFSEPMPLTKDEEPDYYAVEPQRAHAYIYNEAGLTRDQSNQHVQANYEQAQKDLARAQGAALPKMGTSINKFKAAQEQRQQKIDEAQRKVDYWTQVTLAQREIEDAERAEMEAHKKASDEKAALERAAAEKRLAEQRAAREEEMQRQKAEHEKAMLLEDGKPRDAELEAELGHGKAENGTLDAEVQKAIEYVNTRFNLLGADEFIREKLSGATAENRGFWEKVLAEQERITTPEVEKDAITAEEERTISNNELSEYIESGSASPQAVAASVLIAGEIDRESIKKELGIGNADMQRYTFLVKNNGKSIADIAHDLWERYPQTFETDQDARNAILDVLQQTGSTGDLRKMIEEEIRSADISKYEAEAIERDRQSEVEAVYKMPYNDVVAMEEKAIPEIIRNYSDLDENELISLIADDAAKEKTEINPINETNNEHDTESGTGDKVLPTEQTPDTEGRTGSAEPRETERVGSEGAVENASPNQEQGGAETAQAVTPSIERDPIFLANESRMDDIVDRLNEVESRLFDIDDEMSYNPNRELESEKAELERERDELESEYSGLKETNDWERRKAQNGGELTFEQKEEMRQAYEQREKQEAEADNIPSQNIPESVYPSSVDMINPDELSVLTGHNSHTYPIQQGFSGGKGTNNPANEQGNAKKSLPELEDIDFEGALNIPVRTEYDALTVASALCESVNSTVEDAVEYLLSKNDTDIDLSADVLNAVQDYSSGLREDREEYGMRAGDLHDNEAMRDFIQQKLNELESLTPAKKTVTEGESDAELNDPWGISDRISEHEDNWEEDGELGTVHKQTLTIDGKHDVVKVDAPRGRKDNYQTSYEYDGREFGDLKEVTDYIDKKQSVQTAIETASAKVNTEPTDGQKEAGNYKKGHVKVDGYNITIENPKGSVRRGKDANGKEWETPMNNTYGYIRGTEGVDGDHIDVFLSDEPDKGDVFVVDQYNPDGTFDEHKVMYGFNTPEEARAAYLSNYSEGWENGRRLDVSHVSKEQFKKWVDSSHRKTKPFAEYARVQKETDSREPLTARNDGYTIEKRNDITKKGADGYAVNFTERVGRDEFKGQCEIAKQLGGWYSRGKGFVFKNEDAAHDFAETVMGRSVEEVEDEAPITINDISAMNGGENPTKVNVESLFDALRTDGEAKLSDHTETPAQQGLFEYFTGPLKQLVELGKKATNELVKKVLVPSVSERLKTDLKNNGIELSDNYKHTIDNFAIKHTFNEHASEQERLRGQVPISESDFELAEDVIENYDAINVGNNNRGQNVIVYKKAYPDGRIVYVEEVRSPKKGELAFVSMRKYKKSGLPNEASEEASTLGLSAVSDGKGTKLSGAEQEKGEESAETASNNDAEQDAEPKQEKSKYVDDEDAERFEELRKRLHKKLYGQLNSGFDPETFAIGAEMAYLMLKKGARKLNEFAKSMIELMGDGVRPHIKSFYDGARHMMSEDIQKEMSSHEEVDAFDALNFDKKGAKDLVETAAHIDQERRIQEVASLAEEQIKEKRNEARRKRKKAEAQTRDLFDMLLEKSGHDTPGNATLAVRNNHAEQDALTSKQDNNDEKEVHVQSRPGVAEREGGHEPRQNEPLGKSEQHEDERPDGRGVDRRSAGNTEPDAERSGAVSGAVAEQSVEQPAPKAEATEAKKSRKPQPELPTEPQNTRNNHAERGVDYAPKGENARIEANLKAIETMKRLMENGEDATPEDMEVLRKFSGWGGLGAAFSTMKNYTFNPINKRLRSLLSPEQYEAANMSRNSAYYTPAEVIESMWDVARALGFKGGNVLEGSAGIGNIIGLMPQDMSERSNIHAVEIDDVTGNILKLLYPDAKVEIQGFEKTAIPNGSVDLAITNVPFVTGLHVLDETGDKDLSKKFRDIHDFCIAKNVRKLREGGTGIFITSSGTLDNSQKLRNWLVNEGNADVVGAFRMHNKTFGGTGATSDIIVVRKRVNGQKSANAIDVSNVGVLRTVEYTDDNDKTKSLALDFNNYFIEHPENMAGEMRFGFEEGDTFRPTSKALYPSKNAGDQGQMLREWADGLSKMDWEAEAARNNRAEQDAVAYDIADALAEGQTVCEGEMFLNKNGELCVAQRATAVPLAVNANKVKGHTKAECFTSYKGIKDALAEVLDYQTTHDDDAGLQPLIDKLNKAYDAFVKTYGHLNKNTAISFLRNDMDYPSIAALESVTERGTKDGKREVTYGKTDIFSHRVVEKESEPKPTTVKDGIIASIYLNGRVDVPYIAEQLGMGEAEVKQQIIESGLGFENPVTNEMEVSYEYLSGNVREKLHQARANNTDGRFDANVKALERVVPMNIPAHLIDFSLGSSWIEPKLYEDFVKERTGVDVSLRNIGGTWMMKEKESWRTGTEQNKAAGVRSEKLNMMVFGHELISAALQNKTITMSKTEKHYDGTTETVIDKESTQACANRIDEIRQDFKDWARGKMQGDSEMSQKMEKVYNDQFNNYVPKTIPDEFVPEHFGGAARVVNGRPFQLRPHQAKAAIRATTQPLMLAHEVGTGKTYTLITTAMEMRRLGTARKPMIVVQNATVGQFVASAKALYPNAKILTLEDADRNVEGRKNFYAKIRYNDWDMIVVPQSVFERIPDSEERQAKFVEDKIEEKLLVLEQMKEATGNNNSRDPNVRQAEREIEKLRDELNDIRVSMTDRSDKQKEKDEKREAKTKQNAEVQAREMLDRAVDDVANFDDMGIDALLIDEAHEYKHLGFATAMQRGVKGVDPSYSKKSQGVYLKTQAVLENNNGRNVVFATGTPISNTAAEIWTFMRYLMPAETMKDYGMYYFDDFVRNFGNIQNVLEFGASGKYKPVNRFLGYFNLPELVRIWAGVADTVLTREAGGVKDKIPEMEGGQAQDVFLPQTRSLRGVMKFVKQQLEDFENMSGKEKKENSHIPLVMFGIAKAAAVDVRLVESDAPDEPNSKTNETVRQTLRSLKETADYKGTVAIFADNYQNKHSGFNLYEDIRAKLIAAGVPDEQIVVMKSGMTVKKKLEIFDRVNRGEVRVVMGSTFTLGTGVNIQERLHTLIHVDAPNRPMDYTQRNGRILRQGNMHRDWNKPVRVLRFGVEDSLDVTAYQRLKTKGAIADSIMEGKKMISNSMENRSLEEEQDIFGDITAQLSGSQYALLKNQMEKEVRNLESKFKQWQMQQTYIHNQKPRLRGQIRTTEERVASEREALAKLNDAGLGDKITENGAPAIKVGKHEFSGLEAMGDYIKEFNKKQTEIQDAVRASHNYDEKQTRTLVINVGGIDFVVNSTISKFMNRNGADLFASAQTKMTYSCPELGLEEMPVNGQRLKAALEDILNNVVTGKDLRERIERANANIERYNSELAMLESQEGKPFTDSEKLQAAKEKLAEYNALMQKEMEEKEAKYAEVDAEVEAATGVQLSDEEDDAAGSEDSNRYRIREDEPPTNTGIGYKVFVLKDGKLYPPMVANPDGAATPTGVCLDADAAPIAGESKTGRLQVAAGGKCTQGGSGRLAYRPGWHLGEIPYALQFNRLNPETGERELFPANFVWAEVEYSNDVDYQNEAMSYGKNANGKFQHSLAGLPYLPKNGAYRYRTNPNPETDPWIITGAMRVNRILKPSEVDAMVEAAGREPQQRQDGAVTDEMVEALNKDLTRRMNTNKDAIRQEATMLASSYHTPIEIVEDVNTLTAPGNPKKQARMRKAKGWYDTKSGKIVVVMPNNHNVEDVAATMFHEVVAHKGLRELIGEDGYSDFLREVYEHCTEEVRKRIAEKAHKHGWNFEKATDEYLGDLSEKGFEDFDEGDRSIWQKLKDIVLKAIDKFLKSLKLPKWVKLGDNELRYMLWRSHKNLQRGKEDVIEQAQDIVKRGELGLGEEQNLRRSEESGNFVSRRDKAVRENGTVEPGLNAMEVSVVEIKEKSPFDIKKKTKDLKSDVVSYANEHGIIGTMTDAETNGKGAISISKSSIEKMVDDSATDKSVDADTHLSIIPQLRDVIRESVLAETHPDYKKGEDGERKVENGYNGNVLMHRCYGAISVNGEVMRVKVTLKEDGTHKDEPSKAYTYEVTKIELLDSTDGEGVPSTSYTSNPNGTGTSNVKALVPVSVAKLLQNVEKAYDKGKKLLEESQILDENDGLLFRDPGETGDIWSDASMGFEERMTAAATRLASNHADDKRLKNDAMRAIGGNLADIRKAMSLQRTFDMTTVKRVGDLARILMDNGFLNDLNQQEVKRLLAAVKNSVGHETIDGSIQKVMDIMIDNQLHNAKETLNSLVTIKGSKVDAKGVEVQGQLDPDGARTMQVFKKAYKLPEDDINQRISEALNRMSSTDNTVADAAAIEYTGLNLALDYVQNIAASVAEEKALRDDMKVHAEGASSRDKATDSYRQYVASMEDAIRQNKTERVEAYYQLVGRMSDALRESLANAADFREAEKQRVREIQHNANSDMQGRPSDEHHQMTWKEKFVNNSFVQLGFAPLATFDQMLRMFGSKSANGEGYLWNRFMRGWVDAREKEITGVKAKYAILDEKAAEVFRGTKNHGTVRSWGDLIRMERKMPKATVSFWNGGEMQERELTQGNLLYIYMVNKMLDGRIKLRKMGITERDIDNIVDAVDPRFIQLADWLQDEFLVNTRNEYNETHKRMFGASMAAIENYFPLKILANARADKPEDLDNPHEGEGISTTTGSIIKRRRNALALDITGADAFSVILDHVAQMEHWNAFAEWNRDLNTLRTYRHFRNQVQNMTSIYGGGKELWKKFNDVCQMAAGTYRPPRSNFDEAAVNFAKGVTAAKVSFRVFTALKQFLSAPAYIPEVNLIDGLRNPAEPFDWCMENLPVFRERWQSRMSGDPRLLKSDMDWKLWRSRIVELASRIGMSPNAFVDALTVSIGAKGIYETKKAQYLKDGYSDEDADRRAKQDATILFNQTQQSSEGPFTSTMQVDRSWLSVLFTVFRNASMSYQRQLHDALRNMRRNVNPSNYAETIAFMKKQIERDGIDSTAAQSAAERKFKRQLLKDVLRIATFGYIMQFAWNLGAYLPYILFGDDEDEKGKMWDDVWTHTMFGSIEGLTGGDVLSQAGNMLVSGEGNPAYLTKDMPLASDITAALKKLGNGKQAEAFTDLVNIIVQSGIGVNPQSITDTALAIMDACGNDPELSHEAAICIMRILQVPQSQIDKMYFDEVGLSGDEVSQYTPAQLVERYARYKVKRGNVYSPWSWNDEEAIGKQTKKADTTIKERLMRLEPATEPQGTESVNEAYERFAEQTKELQKVETALDKAKKTDLVEAVRLSQELQSDPVAFKQYKTFKALDSKFDKIVGFYLNAQTAEEANLCKQAVVDFKTGMVKVLQSDGPEQQEAIASLTQTMNTFVQDLGKMRPGSSSANVMQVNQ